MLVDAYVFGPVPSTLEAQSDALRPPGTESTLSSAQSDLMARWSHQIVHPGHFLKQEFRPFLKRVLQYAEVVDLQCVDVDSVAEHGAAADNQESGFGGDQGVTLAVHDDATEKRERKPDFAD
jgi:hypothetical protein